MALCLDLLLGHWAILPLKSPWCRYKLHIYFGESFMRSSWGSRCWKCDLPPIELTPYIQVYIFHPRKLCNLETLCRCVQTKMQLPAKEITGVQANEGQIQVMSSLSLQVSVPVIMTSYVGAKNCLESGICCALNCHNSPVLRRTLLLFSINLHCVFRVVETKEVCCSLVSERFVKPRSTCALCSIIL